MTDYDPYIDGKVLNKESKVNLELLRSKTVSNQSSIVEKREGENLPQVSTN